MCQVDQSRMARLYRSTLGKSYIFGFLGFMVGVKLCDLLMYNPQKHEIEKELME